MLNFIIFLGSFFFFLSYVRYQAQRHCHVPQIKELVMGRIHSSPHFLAASLVLFV